MHDFQLSRGDLCGDPTGLRVRVEDVDIYIYDYVHFSVIERSGSGEDEPESGQMSHVAFVHRFTKLGSGFSYRKATWPHVRHSLKRKSSSVPARNSRYFARPGAYLAQNAGHEPMAPFVLSEKSTSMGEKYAECT